MKQSRGWLRLRRKRQLIENCPGGVDFSSTESCVVSKSNCIIIVLMCMGCQSNQIMNYIAVRFNFSEVFSSPYRTPTGLTPFTHWDRGLHRCFRAALCSQPKESCCLSENTQNTRRLLSFCNTHPVLT